MIVHVEYARFKKSKATNKSNPSFYSITRPEKPSELPVDAVFVQIGEAPNSQLAKAAEVETDEHGYIKVDVRQHTNLTGVFAAGDVTDQPIKQVGTAVGQGITAAP